MAVATEYTWNGAGGDDNWTTPANWTNNSGYPNAAVDIAVITGAIRRVIVLDQSVTVGGILFTNTKVEHSISNTAAQTITLADNGYIRLANIASASNQNIYCPIILGGGVSFESFNTTFTDGSDLGYLYFRKQIIGTNMAVSFNGVGGRVRLAGDSSASFAGMMYVNSGRIRSGTDANFGSTSYPVVWGTNSYWDAATAITTKPMVIAGNAQFTIWGNTTHSGPIAISNNATFIIRTGGNGYTFSGPISGEGNVSAAQSTVTFSGANTNTYTGVTMVTNGTLLWLNKTIGMDAIPGTLVIGDALTAGQVQLSKSSQINDNALVYLMNSNATIYGKLTLNGCNEVIAGLVTTGGVANAAVVENNHSSNVSELTISNVTDCTYFGAVRNGSAAKLNIIKDGPAVFYMNGPAQNTGTWTIRGGALGGVSTYGGAVVVASGGTLAPGATNNVVGTMILGNDLTNQSGSSLNFDLGYPNVVGNGTNDLISVLGNVSLDGTLTVTNLTGFETGHKNDKWRLINYSGTISGGGLTAVNWPAGTPYTALGTDTNTAGQVNLVVLSVTNLPDTPAVVFPANNASPVGEAITLDWSDSQDGDGYQVYLWKSVDSPPSSPTGSVTSSQFTLPTALDLGTTYNWQIVTTNSGVLTSTGAVWSFTTRADMRPLVPDTPSPTNGAQEVPVSTILGWANAYSATGYEVCLWIPPDSEPGSPTGVATTNSYNPGALNYLTNYNWKVVATNQYGSATGAVWSFTTRNHRPFAPDSPSPTNGAANVSPSTSLSWTCTDADGYQVYVWLTSGSKPGTPTAEVTSPTYTPTLLDFTNYYWQVVATNAYGFETGAVWTFGTARIVTGINFTWTGAAIDNKWDRPANWTRNNDYPRLASDAAIFTGATQPTVDLNGDKTVGSIIFSNTTAAFTIQNNTLSMANGGSIVVQNTASQSSPTISSALTMLGSLAVTNDKSGNTLTLSGTNSGTSILTLGGVGIISLSADSSSTFTGLIVVQCSDVRYNGTGGLGSTNAPTILNGGSFRNAANTAEPLIVVSNSFIEHWGSGTISSPISISNAVLTLNNGGNTPNYNGYFTGTNGGITLSSGGGYQFSGSSSNTFSGPVTNPGCTFSLNKTAFDGAIAGPLVNSGIVQLSANNQIKDTAPVTLLSSGILRLNSFSDTIGLLIATGNLAVAENTSGATASTLTISNNVDGTYAGQVRNGAAAALNIVKNGSGNWFFNGIATNTGTFMVSGGTLGGTGTIMCAVTVTNSAAVNPGTNTFRAGTLIISNNLVLATNAVLNFELGRPGFVGLGTNDLISGVNNLTFAGTINVTNLSGFETAGISSNWVLITYAGTLTTNQYQLGRVPSAINWVGYEIDTTSQVGQVRLKVTSPRSPYYWLLDQTNIILQVDGGDTGITYSVLGITSNLTNAAAVLYQVSNTTSFTYIDTNALGSVDRRFYRVTESTNGIVSTNAVVFTAVRRQLDPGAWYKYALGIDFGGNNKLDSTLGSQLSKGLTGNDTKTLADLFYLLDAAGNWAMCYLDAGGAWRDYISGNVTNTHVLPWQSFWIKRRNGGSTSYPVYSGYCFTNVSPVTFRSNDWHMITWQLPLDRKESDGVQQGWGFAAAGAKQGGSWLNSDVLTVGDGSGLRFYYLNTNGRWCAVGQTIPAANVDFHLGEAYYYMHRGTGITWTATGP